jgi:uncharacterized protein YfkK (UPF0435 family)
MLSSLSDRKVKSISLKMVNVHVLDLSSVDSANTFNLKQPLTSNQPFSIIDV